MGKTELSGQVFDGVLIYFGKRLSAARKKYRQFIADKISKGRRPELVGGGLRRSQKASGSQGQFECYDDRVPGGGEFVEALQENSAFQSSVALQRVSFQEVQEIVADLFEVSPEEVLHRSRKSAVSEARAVFCYIMVRIIGVSGTEVGKFFPMGPSSVPCSRIPESV